MRRLNLSADNELPALIELVTELSQAKDPQQVIEVYAKGMGKLRGAYGFISLSTEGLEPGQYRIARLLGDDSVDQLHKVSTWDVSDEKPVHQGGVLGQIVSEGQPVIYTDLDAHDDPVLGNQLDGYGTLMAMPLYEDGEISHWGIQLRRGSDAATTSELRDELLRANLVGFAVRHVRTEARLREANHHIRSEVDRIASIQQALLPQPMPSVPGIEIEASYRTFDKAGGDIYDVVPLPRVDGGTAADDRWGILIGDVSGHGPSAAVVMAMLSSILSAYTVPGRNPDDVLSYANRHLVERQIEQSFVTAFLAGYCPETRELTYARAGHPPPLLLTPDEKGKTNTIEALEAVGDLPLGIDTEIGYSLATTHLEPGQTLVLFTDGIVEARNGWGAMFGEDGLRSALATCSTDPTALVMGVRQALERHEAGQRPSDDQTLLAIRVEN